MFDDPLADEAADALDSNVYRNPSLLLPYCENDWVDLAMYAIILTQHATTTEAYENAKDRIETIVKRSTEAYINEHLEAKIQDLREQQEDEMKDALAEYKRDKREMDALDAMSEAYAKDDPKHPDWLERMT